MLLKEALKKLDPNNEEHWTQNGLPRLEVVETLLGASATRAEVTEADPDLTRQTMLEAQQPDAPEDKDTEETDSETQDNDSETEESEDSEDEEDNEEDSEDEEELIQKDGLEGQIRKMSSAIDDENKAIDTAKKNITKLETELIATQTEYNKLFPQASNQENIMAFIKSQNKQRVQRHLTKNKVLAGIKPEDIDPRSPIDRAMARKTGRGHQRPSRV